MIKLPYQIPLGPRRAQNGAPPPPAHHQHTRVRYFFQRGRGHLCWLLVVATLSNMKISVLCALVVVATRQAAVEGFATSFLPTTCRHRASQQQQHVQQGAGSRVGERNPVLHMFFGGPSGTMPKLYDGWFKKTQQIQKDIVAGAKSALRCVCMSGVCRC